MQYLSVLHLFVFAGTLGTSSSERSVSHENIASALVTKQIVVDLLSKGTSTKSHSSTAMFNKASDV